jgi:hypothetical protein
MPTANVEDSIRGYLASLEAKASTPKPVVDREAVKALTAQIKAEADPINKLRLYAAREEARKGVVPEPEDTSGLEAVFIADAKAWADAEGIPVDAFLALNVPGQVLRDAGFTLAGRTSAAAAAPTRATRAPSLPLHEVNRAIDELGPQWKISELAERLDREVATVRNHVKKLVADGQLKEVGEDASGQGRPAKLYDRA